ncbi:MAG: hypothetical protein EOP87_03635, partial [Verrucomicrobiaceae bacterium]
MAPLPAAVIDDGDPGQLAGKLRDIPEGGGKPLAPAAAEVPPGGTTDGFPVHQQLQGRLAFPG